MAADRREFMHVSDAGQGFTTGSGSSYRPRRRMGRAPRRADQDGRGRRA